MFAHMDFLFPKRGKGDEKYWYNLPFLITIKKITQINSHEQKRMNLTQYMFAHMDFLLLAGDRRWKKYCHC